VAFALLGGQSEAGHRMRSTRENRASGWRPGLVAPHSEHIHGLLMGVVTNA
jgi:hypothetical protein